MISPPVITQEHFGKWVQVAAVCDGKTGMMSLYFNGRLVASKGMETKRLLTLGNLELGNWSPTAKKMDVNYGVRDFHGRMDEFALLSRPLSAEEIRRQYDLGLPRLGTAMAEIQQPGSVAQ